MGRYAFFTTRFEYKFVFGVQPSEDIRTFGGVASYDSYERGYLTHRWNQSDIQTIETELNLLLQWIGEEAVDFSKYEKNLEGTYQLKSELYKFYSKDYTQEILARYILGCCIYHQLLYNEVLQADYEG